jgi:hypothetical protein
MTMYEREQIELDARAEIRIRRDSAACAAAREAQRMARQIRRLRRQIRRGTYPTMAQVEAAIPGLLADVKGGER